MMRVNKQYNGRGFTLVELLVALMVTSIVLTAVAALAFALGTANDVTDDTSQKQAQIRFTTLRITELIKHCSLVCTRPGSDIVVWKADDNPQNGKIDVLELAYIETGGDKIRILEFLTCSEFLKEEGFRNHPTPISVLQDSTFKSLLIGQCNERYTELITQCSNVQIVLDTPVPQTQRVGLLFDVEENEVTRNYQINASLRAWAGRLLSSDDSALITDDDYD